ncbi:unnamed protein product [Sphenostylis stenocarpa]|uniref:Uncharacterized protein n=1 Tax=Sphenostylis stenocarpa TaxID=92480 RepID=A0AA86V9K8_9FABA|nr:unnamed protein product [Sphenostylis stenocarpa]
MLIPPAFVCRYITAHSKANKETALTQSMIQSEPSKQQKRAIRILLLPRKGE